ncbi:hypothetical protein BC827DRAFT_1266364 [Russula dissimulans]|nr:hypothetical protein BC827DRAFT_1266364 [Russula dissimulans]
MGSGSRPLALAHCAESCLNSLGFIYAKRRKSGDAVSCEMVRKLDALLDDPSRKQVFHVHFSQHPPLTCIAAPVTEFDIAVVRETESIPIFDRISESAMSDLRAVQPEGFLAMAHGKALEDEWTTLYTAAWTSIEEHMKLGMVEGHQKIVSKSEEAFPHLQDLQMHHVYFERHA